jgi:hypothetical protein
LRVLIFLLLACLATMFSQESSLAQTLTASNVQIEWRVVNRFRFFQDPALFKMHEDAWRQYGSHVDGVGLGEDEKLALMKSSSVLGTEHVLNDRYIPFTRHLRSKFDWRGWGAKTLGQTCWDEAEQKHTACGPDYVLPTSHNIEIWLRPLQPNKLLAEFNCEFRVGTSEPTVAPCDERVNATLPYPAGAAVSVNVSGESGISSEISVKDILIAGMGDSFGSGEGNPDMPVVLDQGKRFRNYYPARLKNDRSGNAQWLDEKCHRSVYGYQLRAALQIAVENPKSAVTFLGYACSGATVEAGILGPQEYVDYVSDDNETNPTARPLKGGKRDAQLYRLIAELCNVEPLRADAGWQCPQGELKRQVDFLFLSIGGNDVGFSNLVAWSTLRSSVSARVAKFLGATVSPSEFASNVGEQLPGLYASLARVLAETVPIRTPEIGFDPSRVILTAYPDILADEKGTVCEAGEEGEDEIKYAANQSLDLFSSWLAVTTKRLQRAHGQLVALHKTMANLAGEATEILRIPCWQLASNNEPYCGVSLKRGERDWKPYDPAAEHFPYALRQRWVRTFNDAYMIINQKVMSKSGRVVERASSAVFSETTGAMHPSAEGHAAMADAMLVDIRAAVEGLLEP